jgi:modified peptide precursor CbpA
MVKGVPSEGWDSFFIGAQGAPHRTEHRRDACATNQLAPRRPLLEPGPAGKPPEEGGQNIMAKSKSSKVKPISIRYTCAPNGDQVGLSHYLMADAKKAK